MARSAKLVFIFARSYFPRAPDEPHIGSITLPSLSFIFGLFKTKSFNILLLISTPTHLMSVGFRVKLTRVSNAQLRNQSLGPNDIGPRSSMRLMNDIFSQLNFVPLFLDMVDPSTNLYPDICIIFRPSNFMR